MEKRTIERINELREFHNIHVNDTDERVELADTLHGDYLSSSYYVGKANYQVISEMENLPTEQNSGLYHDQRVISFELLEKYTDDQYEKLLKVLSFLSDYPCLDDEIYSRLENEAILEYLETDGINDLRNEIYSQQDNDSCIVKELELPENITAEQVLYVFNDLNIDIGPDCGTRTIYFNVKKAAETILQSWRETLLSDLLLCSARGIYIPQNFAEEYQDYIIKKEEYAQDIAILLAGPGSEFYWDSWNSILDNVRLSNGKDDKIYSLYNSENNDIFLVDESITSESFFSL